MHDLSDEFAARAAKVMLRIQAKIFPGRLWAESPHVHDICTHAQYSRNNACNHMVIAVNCSIQQILPCRESGKGPTSDAAVIIDQQLVVSHCLTNQPAQRGKHGDTAVSDLRLPANMRKASWILHASICSASMNKSSRSVLFPTAPCLQTASKGVQGRGNSAPPAADLLDGGGIGQQVQRVKDVGEGVRDTCVALTCQHHSQFENTEHKKTGDKISGSRLPGRVLASAGCTIHTRISIYRESVA